MAWVPAQAQLEEQENFIATAAKVNTNKRECVKEREGERAGGTSAYY